jgi:hypothetical protein
LRALPDDAIVNQELTPATPVAMSAPPVVADVNWRRWRRSSLEVLPGFPPDPRAARRLHDDRA